jgi:hypothetical protein
MTWEQHMANGAVLQGTYTWKDAGTVCFTLTNPPPKPGDGPNCSSVPPNHKAGDSWTQPDPDGKPITYTITPGR